MGGKRTGPQVITVGGTTGQNDRVHAGEICFVVPKLNWFCPRCCYGGSGLPVVNRSGKGDETDTHYRASTFTTSSLKMLASTSSATRRMSTKSHSVTSPTNTCSYRYT